jgi:hypothetical protein
MHASSLPGIRSGLTGNSSANKFNCSEFITSYLSNVMKPLDERPVLFENLVAIPIDLHLSNALHTSLFQTQRKTADAGKKISKVYFFLIVVNMTHSFFLNDEVE